MMIHVQKQTQRIEHEVASPRNGMVSGSLGDGASSHEPSRFFPHLRRLSLLAGLTLATAVAGCGGPPALTSRATEWNLTSPYFDFGIQTQEPHDMPYAAGGLERKIIRLKDNETIILEPKIISAGGTCARSSGQIQCQINRRIIANDCFKGSCTRIQKQWVLLIAWPDQSGPIQPRVKINMTTQKLSN